jgi:rhodanese-related sulfurtransferase
VLLHSFFLFVTFISLLEITQVYFGRINYMKHITTFELKEKIDKNEDFQLIDTREADKFEECHLPGAINIQQIDLPDFKHLIRSDVPVIIYCLYGVKSQAPYLYLTEKLKHRNIYVLEGGIYQWATDIDPTLPIA